MSIANDNYIQGKIDKIITFAPVIDPRLSLSRCMEFDTVAGCYKQDNQLLVESSRLPAK